MQRFLLFLAILTGLFRPSAVHALTAEQKFQLCEGESFMALHMARNYLLLSKQDKSAVLSHIKEDDKFSNDVAQELFSGTAEGRIKHYADFAADRLSACTRREEMDFQKPRDQVRVCFARVDIPFFTVAFKEQGMPKPQAIERAGNILKDRNIYPSALIAVIADQAYSAEKKESPDRLMKTTFWTCVFNEEWFVK